MAFTLVGEKEQNSFAAIEALIGKEVEKAALPQFLGETPAWHPRKRSGNRNPQRKFYKRKPGRH
jgi:hypothetical protein